MGKINRTVNHLKDKPYSKSLTGVFQYGVTGVILRLTSSNFNGMRALRNKSENFWEIFFLIHREISIEQTYTAFSSLVN